MHNPPLQRKSPSLTHWHIHAEMEVLQFKVMAHILEHARTWAERTLPNLAEAVYGDPNVSFHRATAQARPRAPSPLPIRSVSTGDS